MDARERALEFLREHSKCENAFSICPDDNFDGCPCLDDVVALLQSHADEAVNAALAEVRQVLAECEEYFDQRADADLPSGAVGHIPNEEMRLLVQIRALKTGGKP